MTLPVTDPVLIFAGIMLLILVAPMAARKLRLPEIIGLIIAGILFGPHGLGIFARNEIMELFGSVGLLYIMFLAGLEIDLKQLKKNSKHTLIFGLLTFGIPLILGTMLGIKLFGMSLPVAVLLASMFSSHTLVTYPMAGKLGLSKSKTVTTTLGGTIITDSLAMIVLATVAGMGASGVIGGDTLIPDTLPLFLSGKEGLTPLFWIKMFSLMAVYAGAMIYIIPRLARWFFQQVNTDENIEFIFVLVITFSSGFLAHLAGLEPIIGAFIAGLTLNSLIPEKSLLMTRIHFTGDAIFIPFFLISVGMLVNLGLLTTGSQAWVITVGMVVIAMLSKLLAAWISGKTLNYTNNETMLMFGMSVNQAAATLAAALVGYNLGLFTEEIITGTVMMIAITCFTGSMITDRAGRKVALDKEQKAFDPGNTPDRILIPVSAGSESKNIIDVAFMLREKASHEPVYPIHVACDDSDFDEQVSNSENILTNTVIRATATNVPVVPLTTIDLNAASGIIRAARENLISMIIFPWDGQKQFRGQAFGRVIDNTIEIYQKSILINYSPLPLSTSKRILMVLPPFAERHVGFGVFLFLIKQLAEQSGTSISALTGDQRCRNAISDSLDDVQFIPMPDWKKTHEVLQSIATPTDWIILMGVRKGKLIWQPYLDRLPGILTTTLKKNNLSTLIPPAELECEIPDHFSGAEDSEIIFHPDRSIFHIVQTDAHSIVNRLLGKFFVKNDIPKKRTKEILRLVLTEAAVQLSDEAVLLHAHVPYVQESLLFFATTQKPLQIPNTTGMAQILIILLEPAAQDPSIHLNALANIVRFIRKPGMIKTLLKARSYRQLKKTLP